METLLIEPTFPAWRRAARSALARGIPPEELIWEAGGQGSLFGEQLVLAEPAAGSASPRVPKDFVEIARRVACHRAPERWGLLYGVLWRMTHGQPHVLELASDPAVARLKDFDKAVRRDVHKMRAFVRFKSVSTPEGDWWVAWFEPEHHIVELNAPFFVDRFAQLRWSILTPDRCARWDGAELHFSPGVPRDRAPGEDALEELWRIYYGSIFNPARLKLDAMQAEMPRKYWHNLPEASLIPSLVREAEPRVEAMHALSAARSAPGEFQEVPIPPGADLAELQRANRLCQACPIHRDATQAVSGEGPADARIVLLGEQPGDQEDRAGRPFVGPAGALLDRALAQAGLNRSECYVTNTVKHFKWEPRGKRRLHERASPREIATCQAWAEHELQLIRPKVLVCLGATAAQFVFGRDARIGRDRGVLRPSAWAPFTLITAHPSSLLRQRDEGEKEAAFAQLVGDLRLARDALP